jgi:hypothetical protein
LLGWKVDGSPGSVPVGNATDLSRLAVAFLQDAIVMTQACDLAHGKVRNVVLCPTQPLTSYRPMWEAELVARGQNATPKAWRRFCEDVAAGYVWNQALLGEFADPAVGTGVRLVFFHEVYTLPRAFLDHLLAARGQPRLRLRPPYREHLSQSFARFFMRVGLPQAIQLPA